MSGKAILANDNNPYKNGYVLRLWCSECCTCVSCTYVQNMFKLLPYLIYAQHVCYLCTQRAACTHACYRYAAQVFLVCMHVTKVLHICRLHTCKLLVFLMCAACIHAYYYSAAYMLLTHTCKLLVVLIRAACIRACYYSAAYTLAHLQATSVPHMCSLHTCILLQCCIHAAYTHMQATSVPHMCSLHTCILLQCCTPCCTY